MCHVLAQEHTRLRYQSLLASLPTYFHPTGPSFLRFPYLLLPCPAVILSHTYPIAIAIMHLRDLQQARGQIRSALCRGRSSKTALRVCSINAQLRTIRNKGQLILRSLARLGREQYLDWGRSAGGGAGSTRALREILYVVNHESFPPCNTVLTCRKSTLLVYANCVFRSVMPSCLYVVCEVRSM